jgi:hypothetical protein
MISYDTLGALIDGAFQMHIHCNNDKCGRSVKVDLPDLAARLGREHGCMLADLKGKFRCSACRGRDITMSIIPPRRPPG